MAETPREARCACCNDLFVWQKEAESTVTFQSGEYRISWPVCEKCGATLERGLKSRLGHTILGQGVRGALSTLYEAARNFRLDEA